MSETLQVAEKVRRRVSGQIRAIGTKVKRRLSGGEVGRTDPVPVEQGFPKAEYLILVGGIPRHYAGRTASILTKTRLWFEAQGIRSTIVSTYSSAELDDLSHIFAENGALAPGVRLVNLLDYYPDSTSYDGPSIEHPLEEPGLTWIKEDEQPVYRFFDANGVYRIYKRLDYAGRLIIRDWFNENRSRTRRDEFRSDGTIQRTVFMDLQSNAPRQDIHYARNGKPLFNHWMVPGEDGIGFTTQRITFFDADGRPNRVSTDYNQVLHACLDNLVGDKLTFITGEARVGDKVLLGYQRPNVRRLFVLHNAHIREPYLDVHSIRPAYQELFAHRKDADAIVFLTRTQRAEAEAHFGQSPNFRVIPHSAQEPTLRPGVVREPHLAIMMARLDQQKQVDHAITAFKRVVAAIPDAKLEVYGRGELAGELKAQIKRLGLQDSVLLMGYTKDPHLAYQRAALCMMTSRYEGAPLTVVESLMHGCPVISYDLKYGPADILTDGQNGFLVPYGKPKAMAERVIEVMRNPDLQKRMADSAGLSTANFSEETFVRRWAGLFNELASKR